MSIASPEMTIVEKHYAQSGEWQNGSLRIGRYRLVYVHHSTGQSLTVVAVDDSSDELDELVVYREDHWFSSSYDFNNRGTVQGFQFDGPWVQQLKEIFAAMEQQNQAIENEKKIKAEEALAAKAAAEAKKLEKFRALCLQENRITMDGRKEAVALAKATLAQMKDEGWKVHIYRCGFNGYGYYLKRGGFRIVPNRYDSDSRSKAFIARHESFLVECMHSNPQKAFEKQINLVCKAFNDAKVELIQLSSRYRR